MFCFALGIVLDLSLGGISVVSVHFPLLVLHVHPEKFHFILDILVCFFLMLWIFWFGFILFWIFCLVLILFSLILFWFVLVYSQCV